MLGFAKQSGGGVRIESRVGDGTSIRIYLPRTKAKAEERSPSAPAIAAHKDAPAARILLVDDDHAVREVTSTTLRDLGYTVVEAGSGGAALDILTREPTIDLLIIDFAMPGMSGAEVARQARAKRPTLPILFITGFADRAALAGVSETHIVGKPFVNDELATKLRTVLVEEVSGKVVRLRR